VSREDVQKGIEMLGLERNEHIGNVIQGLRAIAPELGVRAVDLAD